MPTASRGSPGDGGSAGSGETDVFVAIHRDQRFIELRRRLWAFIFPMSAAFLVWYLLYVVLSAYARGFMTTVLFGSVNVALAFGLLQFVTTFAIAVVYARYADRRLDPVAEELREELNGAGGEPSGGTPDPATDGPKEDTE